MQIGRIILYIYKDCVARTANLRQDQNQSAKKSHLQATTELLDGK